MAQTPSLRSSLKRLPVVVALVRAARTGVRRTRGRLRRRRVIRRYLQDYEVRKLQLGAGENPLDGWLNTDITPTHRDIVHLDCTRVFPLPTASFDYVWSEHMFEHIDYWAGRRMLAECHRILKPGGRIRVATPDLRTLTRLSADAELDDGQARYLRWVIDSFLPEVARDGNYRASFVINNAFLNEVWAHRFLYDPDTLRDALERSGFDEVRFFRPLDSEDEHLRGIETHGRQIADESINQFETMVAEAVRRTG